MSTLAILVPRSVRPAGRSRHEPRATRGASTLACVVVVGTLVGCGGVQYRTLDTDGVAKAILTEEDYPDRDGWTSTGIATETASDQNTQPLLGTAQGMPPACRTAFASWSGTDTTRKAGVNNNFTKFDPNAAETDVTGALMAQIAVRSFDTPPQSLAKLAEVSRACTGTMTLTHNGIASKVTVAAEDYAQAGAEGLSITTAQPAKGAQKAYTSVIHLGVVVRGNNLIQALALGAADRDVKGLVQRILDVQVPKLEAAAG